MRIDILVVAYRARDYLARCLASVAKNTSEGFRLTVYDNRPKNYPLTWIWNRFAESSDREALVFLNPDALVGPGWDSEVVECLKYPTVGVASPITNASPHRVIHNPVPDQLEPDGIEGVQKSLDALSKDRPRFHLTKDPRAGCGHCFAVRRELWSAFGGFDEVGHPFAGNEDEFNGRLVQAGMDVGICLRAFSFHYRNRSTKDAEEAGELAPNTSRPNFSKPPDGLKFSSI